MSNLSAMLFSVSLDSTWTTKERKEAEIRVLLRKKMSCPENGDFNLDQEGDITIVNRYTSERCFSGKIWATTKATMPKSAEDTFQSDVKAIVLPSNKHQIRNDDTNYLKKQ